jgi:hypothetical protein
MVNSAEQTNNRFTVHRLLFTKLFALCDLTFKSLRLDLSEPVRSHIWRILARFSWLWVCNIRVNLDKTFSWHYFFPER